MCKQFARRGLFSVSVDYRLGWNPVGNTQISAPAPADGCLSQSHSGCQTCVRYFKMEAKTKGNTYKIDTNKIMIVGQVQVAMCGLCYALDKAA
ncbi:MAG: hypothetical protein IPG01_16765 [Chitinophagaceae bacterium]|nr:hypothetical protein [Chitinophagaceae bacterium]